MNQNLFLAQARALLADETDPVANAANLSALIYNSWPEVNWAGFYFRRQQDLVLGPFQGQPACVRIAWGQGVCGHAARTRRSIVVPDVHAFVGHIACDAASASELVVPLIRQGRVLGVLDIDSPRPRRFRSSDLRCAEALVRLYMETLNSVSCAAFG